MVEDLCKMAVRAGDSTSPVILHVPHASRAIPHDVRTGLLLDDGELSAELDLMTDAHTDVIAKQASATARVRPWSFVNPYSRFVVDPERFPDEQEPMLASGMGPVYVRTSLGTPLRMSVDESLIARFFNPYARAMTELVETRLATAGAIVIIDVHSYPKQRLPYEVGGEVRPAVCIGIDDWHTPVWLRTATHEAFAACGETAENTPFAGCYVPLKHYTVDRRVSGVMVEIRRDLYLQAGFTHADAEPAGLRLVAGCLAHLIDVVSSRLR